MVKIKAHYRVPDSCIYKTGEIKNLRGKYYLCLNTFLEPEKRLVVFINNFSVRAIVDETGKRALLLKN